MLQKSSLHLQTQEYVVPTQLGGIFSLWAETK